MEEKYKKIEALMVAEGLTREEVISYLQSKTEVNSSEELSIVNPGFPADDVRSQTKLHWYAFEGGKFSSDPKAYPNCQGVVGWINPDPNTPEGNRIYIVLPYQHRLKYSNYFCKTDVKNTYGGRANTKKLLEYGKKHGVDFPAAEYAYNYCANGVKQGEAFWPAREQLRRIIKNVEGLRKALKLIGGTFEGCLWSSSEGKYDSISEEFECNIRISSPSGPYNHAWAVHSSTGSVYNVLKDHDYSVSFIITY